MSVLKLGWIDFSQDQRKKVISVINLLSEPGAVDELGIGIIRDGFANIFFPGTSTIQTRAKYFFITPYILNDLEHTKVMTADKMIHNLHEQELNLIDVLKKSGEKGIIGELSGKKLKRKPSEIYWNGIRTYGIFRRGKMSLNDYAKLATLMRDKHLKIKEQGNYNSKNDEIDADDENAVSGDMGGGFWKLPAYPGKWKENLSIKLTFEEAEFLRKQIIMTCPDSLMGFVLKNNYDDFLMFESFDEVEGMINLLPESIKKDYIMAKEFADFILGAHLRYNYILSQGEDEGLIENWNIWHANMKKYARINLNSIFIRLDIINHKLKKFLHDYQDTIVNDDIAKLDEILLKREINLKGMKRSKLNNLSEFYYEGWVGLGKLQYRLKNGQNIIEDIFEGLGDVNV